MESSDNVLALHVEEMCGDALTREIVQAVLTMNDEEKKWVLKAGVKCVLFYRTEEGQKAMKEIKLGRKKGYAYCSHCDALSEWHGSLAKVRCLKCGRGGLRPAKDRDWEGIDYDLEAETHEKFYQCKPGVHPKKVEKRSTKPRRKRTPKLRLRIV